MGFRERLFQAVSPWILLRFTTCVGVVIATLVTPYLIVGGPSEAVCSFELFLLIHLLFLSLLDREGLEILPYLGPVTIVTIILTPSEFVPYVAGAAFILFHALVWEPLFEAGVAARKIVG
jgi:hypothetical protein